MNTHILRIAIANDHDFTRKGIAEFISSLDDFEVTMEFSNEQALLNGLANAPCLPQICILDLRSDDMIYHQGVVQKMKHLFPLVKMLTFVSKQNKTAIWDITSMGYNCLMPRNCAPTDLKTALDKLRYDQYYYPESILDVLSSKKISQPLFSTVERRFLTLCCSELTYKEIADRMSLSIRVIESIRVGLFKKLDAVSRTGLVLKAYKCGIISI